MEPLQTWWATELYPSKDDENFGVAGDFEVVKAADAQATIAALQARVNGLEKDSELLRQSRDDFRVKYESVKNDAITLQSQLTQRTAERDTARRRVDELEAREVDVVLLRDDLEKRTAELERVRKKLGETKLYLQQERANRDSLVACVNRDVKTIKELRALILALPKVEGDDAAALVYGSWWRKGGNEQQFDAALSALLQHRQGMEG